MRGIQLQVRRREADTAVRAEGDIGAALLVTWLDQATRGRIPS